MKVNEYKRIYHPSLGKFVYKHIGSGLIVDNIFEPKIQYELSLGRIIWSNITLEFEQPKNKILFRWWEYLVPQLNRLIQFWGTPGTCEGALFVGVRAMIGSVQKRFAHFFFHTTDIELKHQISVI